MAKTINDIKQELGISNSSSFEQLLNIANQYKVFSSAEINNIKAISVLPLPTNVKDRAQELKQRFTDIVLNENKGQLHSINVRTVIILEILEKLIVLSQTALTASSIADDLTTNNSSKVLSAKQGKVLKDTIDGVQEELDSIQALENLNNIVGTYAELEALITIGETTEYQLNAKVQVLNDSTHDGNSTLYNLESLDIINGLVDNYTWRFVGYYDGYNKEQIDEIINDFEQSVTDNFNELSGQLEGALTEQDEKIESLGTLQPSGTDTTANITSKTAPDGIWIATDNGHWYYWNGTQYVDGGVYQATEIPDLSIDLVKQSTYIIGANKYNKDNTLNGYYSYSNGIFVSDNSYRATNYFIPVEPSTDYKFNGMCHICYYDVNKTFISGEVKTYNWLFTVTTPATAYYCRLSPLTERYENFFFKKATDTSNYEPFIVNYKGFQTDKEYDYNKYRFAYVRDEKVCVNKVNDNMTASYITIDFEVTPTKISTKFVCDDAIDNVNNYGTLCVACHRLSAFRIQSITDRSLHLVIYGGYATLTCLGQVYGYYYYATLFNVNINSLLRKGDNNPNELSLTINGNDVTMVFNGSEFTGTFADTHDNDLNLSDFIGQYVTIEHYCNGDRNTFSMPSYTEFKVLGSDASKVAFDNFKREDGILTQMPSGHKYYLMTNEFDGNKIFNGE